MEVEPYPRESLQGLVLRVADHNCVSPYQLTQQVGHRNHNRSLLHQTEDWSSKDLAYVLRLEEAEINHRRDAAGFGTRYNGQTQSLVREVIEARQRRYSPTSLAAEGYYRSEWLCRLTPYCTDSWEVLLSACEVCGASLTWSAGFDRCSSCGFDLRAAKAIKIPTALRPLLAEFSQRIHRHVPGDQVGRLPPIDGEALILAVQHALRLTEPKGKRVALHRLSPNLETIKRIAEALDALTNWPHNFLEKAKTAPCGRGSAVTFYTFESVLRALLEIRPARDETFFKRKLHEALASKSAMGTREAARHYKLDSASLIRHRNAGNLSTVFRWSSERRLLREFAREDVERIASMRAERISAEAASRALGCTYHGIEQMLCLGLLTESRHPLLQDIAPGLHVARSTLEQLEFWIRALSSAPHDRLTSFRKLRRMLPARIFPFGPLLDAMLSRNLRYHLADTEEPLFDRLAFDDEQGRILSALTFHPTDFPTFSFSRKMNQIDAADCFHVWAPKTPGLSKPMSDRTTHDQNRRIPVTSVETLCADVISNAEISARFGATYRDLAKLAKRGMISKAELFGWDRAKVEKHFAQTHSGPSAHCGKAGDVQNSGPRPV